MKRIIQSILVLLGAGLSVAPASADNIKSYHAAMCKQRAQTEHSKIGVRYYGDGDIFGATTNIYCPLIRDQQYSSSQISSAYVEVHNDSADLSCSMYTQYEDAQGVIFDFHTIAASTGKLSTARTRTGKMQLGPYRPDTYRGNEGSYAMYCSLGKYDELFHIYVKEAG